MTATPLQHPSLSLFRLSFSSSVFSRVGLCVFELLAFANGYKGLHVQVLGLNHLARATSQSLFVSGHELFQL